VKVSLAPSAGANAVAANVVVVPCNVPLFPSVVLVPVLLQLVVVAKTMPQIPANKKAENLGRGNGKHHIRNPPETMPAPSGNQGVRGRWLLLTGRPGRSEALVVLIVSAVLPPPFTELGAKLQVAPRGNPEQLKFTVPVKPLSGVTCIETGAVVAPLMTLASR